MSEHCELLAVRHGQSEWNLLGRWQGQADPPLTGLGERQATAAAAALAPSRANGSEAGHDAGAPAAGGANRHAAVFDLVVSSDLQRARRTAEIMARCLGVSEVIADRALRERDAGPWEGLTRAQIDAGWPGDVAARKWPPGFEPDENVAQRLLPALRAHLSKPGCVLLVGHAGVLKTIDARLGLGNARVHNLAGRWFRVDAATVGTCWGWEQLVPLEAVELVNSNADLTLE